MNLKQSLFHLYHQARQLQIEMKKGAGSLVDSFKPSGHVEAVLRYADGKKKGEVYRTIKGRNIITSTLSGSAPTGGRDVIRRLIIDPTIATGGSESLKNTTGAVVSRMILGTNTTAEAVTDTFATMTTGGVPSGTATISSVSLDAVNPYVTFSAVWDQTQGNANNISEAGLLGPAVRSDFFARKTFSPFTKTTDFTLQINWTLRF